jgi:lantibiotic biosynthesis protein
MTTSTSWRPLVTNGLAERLRASLDEILVAMKARPPANEQPWTALLYLYADRVDRSDKHAAAFNEVLERALASISEGVHSTALYGGFPGVAWLASHVTELEAGIEDPYVDIDTTLRRLLARSPWPAPYDLISGIVGIGVYFLERLTVSRALSVASECLALIADRLAELAEHTGAGTTWFTDPKFLPEWQRTQAPNGYYNFGLAHGVPGVIALLGQICEANIGGARARELLAGGVDWLLAEASTHERSRFASWRTEDAPGDPAQSLSLAWCYGDLGLSVALLRAARCVDEPRWERAAVELARNVAARRDGGHRMPVDAALCHGTAGVAHVFNRIFQATGDAIFEEAACHWFERTLQMRHQGAGIAGYRAFHVTPDNTPGRWVDDSRFLEGVTGIGLSFLAATSEVEPDWDRLLLISVPPRPVGELTER